MFQRAAFCAVAAGVMMSLFTPALSKPHRSLNHVEPIVMLGQNTKRIPSKSSSQAGKTIRVFLGYDRKHKVYQQFEAYEGNKLVYKGLASGAYTNKFFSTKSHPKEAHNHIGVFHVGSREKLHISQTYDQVKMRDCLFFCNGHAIHACKRSDIKRLGRPASHGCVRVSPRNARRLFNWAGSAPVLVEVMR